MTKIRFSLINIKIRILLLLFFVTLTLKVNSQTIKEEWVIENNQSCKVFDPYFSDGVTMKWEGYCIDGKANGFGKLTKFLHGEYESTYEGEYKNGVREGQGKITYSDGTIQTGKFLNGHMIGEGVMIYEDGSKYSGNFINYSQHGIGTLDFADGDKMIGFFVSDELYTGKIINKEGKITFFNNKQEIDEEIKPIKSTYQPKIGIELTEYFDKYFSRCGKDNHVYYRRIIYQAENKPSDTVKTYYKSGQLFSKAFAVYLDYDDLNKSYHQGDAVFYFEDGKIKEKLYLLNNKVDGTNTSYYPNGKIEKEINYVGGLKHGYWKEWYENGKPKSVAIYEDDYLLPDFYVEYDENGSIK